ncbi:MAG: single-stranded DNA-binding protein [Magnetococcales bacterium]|nr:single-stranded DNA-binding protein [Magnetococcales bacterium]
MPAPTSPPETSNRVVLAGLLVDRPVERVTPSGRLVVEFELEHHSAVRDLAPLERVALRIGVVALDQVASTCRTLAAGSAVEVEGVLNQKLWSRDGRERRGRVEMVARNIRIDVSSSPLNLDNTPEDGHSRIEVING